MSANDNFSLHDDEELSLHDDASLDGSAPASNKGDAPAKHTTNYHTNTFSNIKLPVLQKDDYDTWAMEMEHYLEYIDNEVWKVIQNGNSKKRVTKGKDGVYRVLPSTTQEEQFADEKERKARTLLLMAVPKDHLRRFHGMDDAKEIWAAIKTRRDWKKGYDRFQKLLSQLDALGAGVSDEDTNHKFLRSLPPAWDTKASSSKHKPSHSSGSYSSYTTSSSKATPTATPGLADEVIHSFLATNADDVDLIHEDLDQIDDLDLEEMDINWQIAMTAIRLRRSASLMVKRRSDSIGYMTTDEELNHALMAFTVIMRETDEGYYDIPLYSKFKQVEYKGVPHPLSGDYTPREQEDIDDSQQGLGLIILQSFTRSTTPTRQ
ncbi:hypothetical protein Tco_0145662 [Tanacetum coccineum]